LATTANFKKPKPSKFLLMQMVHSHATGWFILMQLDGSFSCNWMVHFSCNWMVHSHATGWFILMQLDNQLFCFKPPTKDLNDI